MSTENDGRLRRDAGASRRSREAEDRTVASDRNLSDADRLEMFRRQMFNDALPDLPHIEGYHLCWLTTTNKNDPITKRLRLGYELLKAEEVPGMDLIANPSGEFAGCVSINEMVAAKLPMSLYQAFMREAHHDAPRRDEEILTERAEAMKADAEAAGGKLLEEEGFADLYHEPTAPREFL